MLTPLAFAALLFIFATTISAQNRPNISAQTSGSLAELVDKHWVLLLVKRSAVFDVRDGQSALIEEALKPDLRPVRRYRMAFNTIAGKLNKFLKKRRNMGAVDRVEDADFVVFFNLLEYRWPLGAPYPYGELFVIIKPESGAKGRIVWKSKKVQWAGDAADDLIDDLRLVQWNR
ncbi:MAG TPA: hypothetical protein VGC89_21830 [Pyrinomonadaceae bacterium]